MKVVKYSRLSNSVGAMMMFLLCGLSCAAESVAEKLTAAKITEVLSSLEGVSEVERKELAVYGQKGVFISNSVRVGLKSRIGVVELLKKLSEELDKTVFSGDNVKFLGTTIENPFPQLAIRYFDGFQVGELRVVLFDKGDNEYKACFDIHAQPRPELDMGKLERPPEELDRE